MTQWTDATAAAIFPAPTDQSKVPPTGTKEEIRALVESRHPFALCNLCGRPVYQHWRTSLQPVADSAGERPSSVPSADCVTPVNNVMEAEYEKLLAEQVMRKLQSGKPQSVRFEDQLKQQSTMQQVQEQRRLALRAAEQELLQFQRTRQQQAAGLQNVPPSSPPLDLNWWQRVRGGK